MKSRINQYALTLALGLSSLACSGSDTIAQPGSPGINQTEIPMLTDEEMFKRVPLNTREANPCSPKNPGPAWRGILIQAPKQVKLDPKSDSAPAIIPICGLYTLELLSLMDAAPMKLIVRNTTTNQLYQGSVVDSDPSPEAPPPDEEPLDPALLEGMASSSYFNPNLTEYVNLPAEPAVYEVVVEYGGLQSNKVVIEVR